VKLGIFTDVHGDLISLQKVLAALEQMGAEHLVCLGDLVVHGQRPNEVVDLVRTLAIPVVGGNHDHGAVHYGRDPDIVFFNPKSELHTALTQPLLSEANRAYLSGLPDRLHPCPEVCCVHAGYRDRYALLYAPVNVEQVFEDAPAPLTLCGHTHRTRIHRRTPEGRIEEIDPWAEGALGWTGELDWPSNRYILNCGNTSQLLFDRLPSVCGLLDTDARTISWKRVL
jgi:predicted phosphodiesterase